jgi:hypothetical protein
VVTENLLQRGKLDFRLWFILEFISENLPEQEKNPDFSLIDDMIIAPQQYDKLYTNSSRSSQDDKIWPNATVQYLLHDNFSK